MLLVSVSAVPALADVDPTIPELDRAAAVYKQQTSADIDSTIAGVEQLLAALQNKDVAAAHQAWINARVGWERSQVFTSSLFRDLEQKINGWPDAKAGFHAIEIKLFGPSGEFPVPETQALLGNLTTFRELCRKQVFSGHMVLVGAAELAYEIGDRKAAGGESAASGTSLNDLQHNVEGIALAWNTVFADYVAKTTPHDAKDIAKQLDAVRALVSVQALDQIDPAKLTQESKTLAEWLAEVALHLDWRRPDYTTRD
jgi:iron uptake system component EfeO